MKIINKTLLILLSITLIFTPYCVNAEPESTNTPTETPEVTPTQEPTPNPTPEETQTPETTPTPEPTPSPTPEPTQEPTPSPTPEEKKSISLDESKITLKAGESKKITATVTPSNSTVTWKSSDKEVATVDENGKVTAGTKNGDTIITATIEGSKDIYAECKVVVSGNEESNKLSNIATLKLLEITNGKLDKKFKSDVFEYSVTIDKNVSSLDIDYELSDKKAKAFPPSDSKNKNLENGDVLSFKVVAEDGKTNKTYKLTIVKETPSVNLKSLKINGYALNEIFKASKVEYTASIPYEIDTITVEANPESSDASIKVSGDKNLKVGENTVTITVKNNNGESKKYTIIVTREKEVSVEENPTSIITSSDIINDNETTTNNTNNPNNHNSDNNDDFLKYVIVSIACLILFIIGGIGIYFYLKTSPRRLRKMLVEEQEEISPIVEVEEEITLKGLEEIMTKEDFQVKEFTEQDLMTDEVVVSEENLISDEEREMKKRSQLEKLFEDDEDV